MVRDCPEKSKYRQMLNFFIDAAAAHVVLANINDEPNDDDCELAKFIWENGKYIEEDSCP